MNSNKGFYVYTPQDFHIAVENERARRKYDTGYRKLDCLARPEAGKVTLIPAFTDHGKSVFLRNLCYNMFSKYHDTDFIYYTNEDNAYEVYLHLARLAHYELEEKKTDTIFTPQYIDDCMSRKQFPVYHNIMRLQEGMCQRIHVYDEQVSVSEIEKQLDDALTKFPKTGVVFVDYLQDVMPDSFSGQHHADLERIMIYMANTAKVTNTAFIVAAQYRPDIKHNPKKWDIVGLTKVFGSSSLYKKPRLFYSLFNRTRFEGAILHEEIKTDTDELEIDILKQKKQYYGEYLTFDLCKKSGRITESTRVIDRAFDITGEKKDDFEK